MPTADHGAHGFLVRSPRQVLSRAQLDDRVWDSCREWQDEATVRGVDYRFEPLSRAWWWLRTTHWLRIRPGIRDESVPERCAVLMKPLDQGFSTNLSP